MYTIGDEDIQEMKSSLGIIQHYLNAMFQDFEKLNKLPDEVVIISKTLGKLGRKIELIKQK